MKFIFVIPAIVLSLLSNLSFGQSININSVIPLSNTIIESSGLIFFDNRLITHNDSGREAKLYEVDTVTGAVIRTVQLLKASNVDWEDVAQDDNFIYIGDIGNNNGNRRDLKIYRISKVDYLSSTVVSNVDTILYSYIDQQNFAVNRFSNYDAEGLVAVDDSLYLFTKNWGNQKTYIYSLSKLPGSYQAKKIDSLNVQGLVTAAEYDAINDELFLLTFKVPAPVVYKCYNFSNTRFATQQVSALPVSGNTQMEGICKGNGDVYWISSETFQTNPASLFNITMVSVPTGGVEDSEDESFLLYPNPSEGKLNCSLEIFIEIYTQQGIPLYSAKGSSFDLSALNKGMYIVNVHTADGSIRKEKLIIK